LLNKLNNPNIKDIHIVFCKNWEVIVETQTLKDIMHQSPCKDRSIMFGVTREGVDELDASEDMFEPVRYYIPSDGTLWIHVTQGINGMDFPKKPRLFKIIMPCDCRLRMTILNDLN